MSESEQPKKRRFWQLHLSTAVVLMIVAGALLWVASGMGILTESRIMVPISFVVLLFIPTLIAVTVFCESLIRRSEGRKP